MKIYKFSVNFRKEKLYKKGKYRLKNTMETKNMKNKNTKKANTIDNHKRLVYNVDINF